MLETASYLSCWRFIYCICQTHHCFPMRKPILSMGISQARFVFSLWSRPSNTKLHKSRHVIFQRYRFPPFPVFSTPRLSRPLRPPCASPLWPALHFPFPFPFPFRYQPCLCIVEFHHCAYTTPSQILSSLCVYKSLSSRFWKHSSFPPACHSSLFPNTAQSLFSHRNPKIVWLTIPFFQLPRFHVVRFRYRTL